MIENDRLIAGWRVLLRAAGACRVLLRRRPRLRRHCAGRRRRRSTRGDTAWMLASTALVLMMTIPGLALFYAGMVRKKNVLATLMQSFAICCLVTIVWMVAGYSLAFTNGNAYIGDLSRFFLHGLRRQLGQAVHCSAPASIAATQTRSPRAST